jgi:hypothetical protein
MIADTLEVLRGTLFTKMFLGRGFGRYTVGDGEVKSFEVRITKWW